MTHLRCLISASIAAGLVLALAPSSAIGEVCENFEEKRENKPATCRRLWEAVGLPTFGGDADVDATIVCHTAYVVSHNNERKTPDWVIERLTRAQAKGEFDRPSTKFKSETGVCDNAAAKDDQYKSSTYDRGHQAPSADFSSNEDLMVESFILSNAVPQEGLGFNRGIWKDFEALVRKLAIDRGEIYVITGPIYDDGTVTPAISKHNNACRNAIAFVAPRRDQICGKTRRCAEGEGVAVPIGLFKIIHDPKNNRTNAYVMPNVDHRGREKTRAIEFIKKFRTTVRSVERSTGLSFLSALPERTRRQQVEECVATMLH